MSFARNCEEADTQKVVGPGPFGCKGTHVEGCFADVQIISIEYRGDVCQYRPSANVSLGRFGFVY